MENTLNGEKGITIEHISVYRWTNNLRKIWDPLLQSDIGLIKLKNHATVP